MSASIRRSPAHLAEVTRLFRGLQGLRIVPMAVFFFAWGLPGALGALGVPVQIGDVAFGLATLAALAVAAFAERRIARWYDEHYGIVEQASRLHGVLGAVGYVALFPVALLWLGFGNPPVNPVLVLLGVGLLFHWRPRAGLRMHYAAAGGLVLAASFYVPASADATASLTLLSMFGGGGLLLVLGVLDHRELVRALGPPTMDTPAADARVSGAEGSIVGEQDA